MPTYLSREAALAVSKREYADLEVPELGGTLRISGVSASLIVKVQELNAAARKAGDTTNLSLFMLVLENCVVDGEGKPLFDGPSAKSFFDSITMQTVLSIMDAVPGDVFKSSIARAKAESAAKEAGLAVVEAAPPVPSETAPAVA